MLRVYAYTAGREDGYRPHPKGHGHLAIPYIKTRTGKVNVDENSCIVEFNGGAREVWTKTFMEFATSELSVTDINKLVAQDHEERKNVQPD